MKDSMFKKIGMTIARSVALFVFFVLVATVSRLIFRGNLFEEDMLSQRAIAAWDLAFLLFIFQSAAFAVNRHVTESKRGFLEGYAQGQRFGKVKSIFLTPELYVEFLCIALLSLILPLSFTYDCVGLALFGKDCGKMQVMPVILPILLALEVFVHLSVRSAWVSDGMRVKVKKGRNDFARTVQGMGLTAMVYCAASLMIPWALPFIITVGNLGAGAIVFLYVAIAILIAILAVIASFYIRAIRKRKEFVQKLKKYCKEQNVTLSDIKKPYASVFVQHEGIDFTVERDGIVYDCKLTASIFPSSPMVFGDQGMGIRQDSLRLFGVSILHLNTMIDYRMDNRPTENKKIVIVLPVPKNIYVSVDGCPPRPADTGENVGAYTLYTAIGFLNALERGILK